MLICDYPVTSRSIRLRTCESRWTTDREVRFASNNDH